MRVSRRHVLAGGLLLPWAASSTARPTKDALADLERRSGGRLGFCLLDTGTGRIMGQRLDARFAMCSTFKLPLAAWALHLSDQGMLQLDEVLPLTEQDRVSHAPVTGPLIGKGGMTIEALVEAAQKNSDNAAANVVLRRLGGPAAFTGWLRSIGDATTRLDRYETELNLVPPGDHRDTSTPRAFARTVAKLTTGGVLFPSSRQKLVRWTVETGTGLKRLRAGLPDTWIAGDKTGTAFADGMAPKVNDVAIAWPPGAAPIVLSCFLEGPKAGQETSSEMEKIHAEAVKIALESFHYGANHRITHS
ncbi:MAG: class beta-lactamase [Pseudomonadota bacterium]